jgi:hypothetical protein
MSTIAYGADLVEMHLLERDPVRRGLGAPQDLERPERAREHAIGKLRPLEEPADLGEVPVGLRLARLDPELERLEAVALDARLREREALERERAKPPVDLLERRSQRDEGAEDHVPRGARHAVEIDDHARLPARDWRAITPAA